MALELINRSWLEGGEQDRVLSALHLLRELVVVEAETQTNPLADLKIKSNDLSALRFVLDGSEEGAVSPRALGHHLGITDSESTGSSFPPM